MAAASLFLAAKVEEQPRKLEHIIRVKQICQHRSQEPLDVRSEVSPMKWLKYSSILFKS